MIRTSALICDICGHLPDLSMIRINSFEQFFPLLAPRSSLPGYYSLVRTMSRL